MADKRPSTCAIHETVHANLREQLKPLEHIPTMRVQLNFIIAGIVLVTGLVAAPLFNHFLKITTSRAGTMPAIAFQPPPILMEKTK